METLEALLINLQVAFCGLSEEKLKDVCSKVNITLAPGSKGGLAPVVHRPDNFILWISHYPTVSICAKISVFPLVQANMHTLTTAKFGSVRKPWTHLT